MVPVFRARFDSMSGFSFNVGPGGVTLSRDPLSLSGLLNLVTYLPLVIWTILALMGLCLPIPLLKDLRTRVSLSIHKDLRTILCVCVSLSIALL